MTQYIVDAFTDRVFSGNPAAVCFVGEWPGEQVMKDQNLLAQLTGRIQNATAKGTAYDCVSRSFCPKLGIPEDPVCGSAHCQIADFWSQQLGKQEIRAFQASPRTGLLTCRILNNATIAISGQAVLFSRAELMSIKKADLRLESYKSK